MNFLDISSFFNKVLCLNKVSMKICKGKLREAISLKKKTVEIQALPKLTGPSPPPPLFWAVTEHFHA